MRLIKLLKFIKVHWVMLMVIISFLDYDFRIDFIV